jgi:predicted nucleic acid-binding Zn ribbon protein
VEPARQGARRVSRRSAPRPAAEALRLARQRAVPKTRLAALQAAWGGVVGAQLAERAQPVSERARKVTIECTDTVWAQELDLMQGELLDRLRARLGDSAPEALCFRVNGERF